MISRTTMKALSKIFCKVHHIDFREMNWYMTHDLRDAKFENWGDFEQNLKKQWEAK